MISELGTKTLRELFGGNISTTQVLQGISSGMSDCGVDVVIDPECTCPYAVIEKKMIVLPSTVKSEKALLVVNWFVDHESGHLIYTPPLKPIINSWTKHSEMVVALKKIGFDGFPESLLMAAKGMLNLVEDARIEHLMIGRLPGTKKHFIGGPLAVGLETMIEDMVAKAFEAQQAQGLPEPPLNPFWLGQMHAYFILDGRHNQHPKQHVRKVLGTNFPSVMWVLDVVEEEFGDITDISKARFDELVKRTDKAMARIFEKVLNGDEEDEEEQKQGQKSKQKKGRGDASSNPLNNKFKKGKGKSTEGTPFEDSPNGSGEGAEKEDGEPGEEEGKGKSSGEGEEEDEEDSGSGGEEQEGEDNADDDDSGADSDSSDGDEEHEGESEDAGDDEADEGGDEGEGDDEGEGESDSGGSEEPGENDATATPRQVPQQVEEWAKEAQADMAELMRGGADGDAPTGEEHASGRTPSASNPNCNHNASASGMPDAYYQNIRPHTRSVLINSIEMGNIINTTEPTFQTYDDLIRGLMPPNLGPASRKLLGRFKGAPGEDWVGNRINPRRLAQIKAGTAYGKKLCVRRNQTLDSRKGLAVMVLIDCSGSMTNSVPGFKVKNRLVNSKFAIAHAVARGMARLLQTINVPFAVGGFTTADPKHGVGSRYGSYSRNCDLIHFLFKDFHEPWSTSEQKMLAMNSFTQLQYKGTTIYSNCNSDGDSVLWAASHLLLREEESKVLIVLSDGLPAGGDSTMQSGFLKWVVKRIQLAGVRVGALGLGCEGVSHYYDKYELVDEFPAGMGTETTAPLFIQEKVIRLVDRLMTDDKEQGV